MKLLSNIGCDENNVVVFNRLIKINNNRLVGQMIRAEKSCEIQIGDIITVADELYTVTAVAPYAGGCRAGVTLRKVVVGKRLLWAGVNERV